MIHVEDVVDLTQQELSKKEKSQKIPRLAKKSFKYPLVVINSPFPRDPIAVTKWIPLFGKKIIDIYMDQDRLVCYDKNYLNQFIEFAREYEKIDGKSPRLETDFS